MAEQQLNSEKRPLRSSPWWPALLSGLVAPGVGQLANKELKKGILLLVVSIGCFLWFSKVLTEQISVFIHTPPETWSQDPVLLKETLYKLIQQNGGMFSSFYALMILTWIYGVVDAYLTARSQLKQTSAPLHEDSDPVS